ncbi:hypothetical protein BCR34DRAFT_557869 [Clohesyomyces aquaticus]|uniref:Uncharacterized protein n=1 Tax=Clohesyomyces aquaticus TaxID=1231657 RepID=A0A1Y2A097_9PLEO|nr:hypothetical protein BCR34DRAFT_557869 [Clohesyomyces aquaticus]
MKCLGRHCFGNDVEKWTCPTCRELVWFGFADDYFYCDCGRYRITNAGFKCVSIMHGHCKQPEVRHMLYMSYD